MDRREVRNEFGLDEYNASDVRKEGMKRNAPWILAVVAVLLILGVALYAKSHKGSQTASNPPLAITTTGSSAR